MCRMFFPGMGNFFPDSDRLKPLALRFVALFTLAVAFPGPAAEAQKPAALKKYWIELADKNNSPYCTCRPWEFLSARTLERRALAGIPVEENDLPVNPAYLQALRQKGAVIHNTSRWLNAATVIADSATAASLRDLPFVQKVKYLGPHIRIRNAPDRMPKKRVPLAEVPQIKGKFGSWGYAGRQNSLLGLNLLHAAGYRGRDIWVAVMDGGFTNADTIALFDSVALDRRLMQGHDFVERDGAVFESAAHGSSVLGVMAGNIPGWFIGGAPDATYFLLKTEDTGGEYPVEEANWIAGVEWADSMGIDLVNASLGYTQFNDTTLGHWYRELDGRTAIGSRGAAIAATKGLINCNSAGNEGDGPWHYIGAPADAPGIVAVGAVDMDGKHAVFSSFGPTADGRLKPDLSAPGAPVVSTAGHDAELDLAFGTSLASPMLCGAFAALWSACPDKTAEEVMNAVFASADQYDRPDNAKGYGIPDFDRAWLQLGGFVSGAAVNDSREGFFSSEANRLQFLVFAPVDHICALQLHDGLGQPVPVQLLDFKQYKISTLSVLAPVTMPPGPCRLTVVTDTGCLQLWALVF